MSDVDVTLYRLRRLFVVKIESYGLDTWHVHLFSRDDGAQVAYGAAELLHNAVQAAVAELGIS